jgi:hypothetical protein
MAKRNVPIIGQPVFVLTQNNFTDKIKVTQGISSLNTLAYIGVNAIMVMSVGYTDAKMDKIIINKDYKDDDGKDSAIITEAEEPSGRRKNAMDIFVDESEANAVAYGMNEQFKQECKSILDAVGMCYHEYDTIQRALKGAK